MISHEKTDLETSARMSGLDMLGVRNRFGFEFHETGAATDKLHMLYTWSDMTVKNYMKKTSLLQVKWLSKCSDGRKFERYLENFISARSLRNTYLCI